MSWSDISRLPTPRELRQFAAVVLINLVVVGIWQGTVHDNWGLGRTLLATGSAIGLLGSIRPQAIRWLYIGWMMAIFPVGWVLSHLLLAAAYYGMIVPL